MGRKKAKASENGAEGAGAPEEGTAGVDQQPNGNHPPEPLAAQPSATATAESADPEATPAPKIEKKPKGPKPPAPELRIVARARGGIQGFTGPDWKASETFKLPASDEVEVTFSVDGTILATVDHPAGLVVLYDAATGQPKQSIAEPKVTNLYLSPKGTYVVTMRRYEKDDVPNLAVWDVASGREAKRMLQSRWPALLWSADEAVCVRMTNNGIQATGGADFGTEQTTAKLENSKVDAVSLSPGLPPYLAVFSKQSKGQPANIKVYKAPNLAEEIVQKSMFKADSCTIMWNSVGNAAILNCRTDQDSTGKSYYGQSILYLLLPKEKDAINLTVGKAGEQIHDVAWAPSGLEFIVVAGLMPLNRAVLFNSKAETLFDFGTSPRNTVSWAPNSRYLALCGFGNLAGEIQFWDRWKLEKGTGKIGTCKVSACTEHAWAPDSRHFMCAVTAPRMKVDNKIVIFKNNGVSVFTTPFPTELYQAAFKPEQAKLYPVRDPSPPPAEHLVKHAAIAAPTLFKARGSSGVADLVRRERAGPSGPSGGSAMRAPVPDNYIPGMPPPKPKAKPKAPPKPKAAAK